MIVASDRSVGAAAPPWRFLVSVGLVALVVAWRVAAPMNADTSWLLSAAEAWLDGARLYVDLIETNPPASIVLYVPAVALARAVGTTPETAVTLLTILAALASLALTTAILDAGGLVRRDRLGAVTLLGVALLLLVPGRAFTEREHLAAILGLPLVLAFACRIAGARLLAPLALMAGLGGGLTIAIKPVFALAYLGPAMLCCLRQGWRPTLGAWEGAVACGIALAYAVAVAVACPVFLDRIVPWVAAAYLPSGSGLPSLLTSETTLITIGLAALPLRATLRREADPLVAALSLASLGFLAAFIVQGRLWPYHALPQMLFAAGALAAWLDAARRRGLPAAPAVATIVAGTGLLCGATALLDLHFDVDDAAPGLRQAIERVAAHPRMMSISNEIALGHPLVREIGGRWVGSFAHNWVSAGRAFAAATAGATPALDAFAAEEKAIVARDIETRHPDAIVVEGVAEPYATSTPELRAAFAPYRKSGTYGLADLWLRDPATDEARR